MSGIGLLVLNTQDNMSQDTFYSTKVTRKSCGNIDVGDGCWSLKLNNYILMFKSKANSKKLVLLDLVYEF